MEVISYRELQRIPHKVLDEFIEESGKVIVTVGNQYHYEIKKIDENSINNSNKSL